MNKEMIVEVRRNDLTPHPKICWKDARNLNFTRMQKSIFYTFKKCSYWCVGLFKLQIFFVKNRVGNGEYFQINLIWVLSIDFRVLFSLDLNILCCVLPESRHWNAPNVTIIGKSSIILCHYSVIVQFFHRVIIILLNGSSRWKSSQYYI